jgi:hypothetical protein
VKHALSLSFILLVVGAVSAAPLDLQINAAMKEKTTRTAAQRKIDSQLLFALYRERGEAETKGVPAGDLRVKFDAKRRALVTIRARVTTDLFATIKKLGGEVVSSSERDNDIRAWLPLGKLEELASSKTVSAIMPAEEATTNRAK